MGNAAVAVTALLGLLLWTRIGRGRAEAVEAEVISALGLTERPPPQDPSAEASKSHDAEADEASDNPQKNPSSANQTIYVDLRNGSEASEALAEIAQQQSDGHARLIVKYYAQGHQQAFVTFIASIAFAVVGFGVIIAACVYLLTHPKDPEPAAISGAVGLVTQGVGYLFFRRADNARGLMMQLIDKLRDDRDREIKFIAGMVSANSIVSPSLRDAVKVATAVQLAGVSMSPEQIGAIARESARPSTTNAAPIFINPPPKSDTPASTP
ncbi:TRADD-N-associated membrane domain-containing protein [Micromonospora sp. LH3U1]|uniref:TRADD-N-associated membrane domain-containing protein n=1 Tax=Micromonospora sp. LH3U1 TaxID=3018339 RepID=UPI002349BDE5|nr:hypothetical protein [Micromonospora sp. LH3U1]WCN84284.1 hypothetical protein PCA76_15120 [Micromonospora sp. LH3U1]